jgi:hypothetical protein
VITYSAGKAVKENRVSAAGKACIIWEKMRNLEREIRNLNLSFSARLETFSRNRILGRHFGKE